MCASQAHIVIPQKSVKYFDWEAPIRRDVRRRRSASDILTRATQRPHPFFAVTKGDGSFEIKGLPEGAYTLELWHERLGTQTLPVTVTAAAPAKVSASFKPPS